MKVSYGRRLTVGGGAGFFGAAAGFFGATAGLFGVGGVAAVRRIAAAGFFAFPGGVASEDARANASSPSQVGSPESDEANASSQVGSMGSAGSAAAASAAAAAAAGSASGAADPDPDPAAGGAGSAGLPGAEPVVTAGVVGGDVGGEESPAVADGEAAGASRDSRYQVYAPPLPRRMAPIAPAMIQPRPGPERTLAGGAKSAVPTTTCFQTLTSFGEIGGRGAREGMAPGTSWLVETSIVESLSGRLAIRCRV